MKSKIILSVWFLVFLGFFFPSENIAAETFYRLLELAPTMFLGRSPVSNFFSPSFLLFIGVTHSSPQFSISLVFGLLCAPRVVSNAVI